MQVGTCLICLYSLFWISPYLPRSLGYLDGSPTTNSRFGNAPGGEFVMDDVQCQGTGEIFRMSSKKKGVFLLRVTRISSVSAGTRAMTIVMPARLPGWFVRVEVRQATDEGFGEEISYERLFCCLCRVYCQAQGAWELFSPLVGDFSSAERAGTSSSTCT